MSVSINGTSGLVFNDASTQSTAATGFGFKNRIINGAMMIDQRNAGASVNNSTSSVYPVDRWAVYGSVSSKLSLQQNAGSVTPPTGFSSYVGATSLSSYSVGAGEEFEIFQRIEGLNCADLGWGTASASPVTLSFWVRSSLTGTFGGWLLNSAQNRSYVFTYTINAANTWEQKTITIAGDTSGTWLTTNGVGIGIGFSLGAGSTYSKAAGSWGAGYYIGATGQTSVVGTNGATFYITGVQLEKGSTATSFDYRPYGTELALCQRYYYKWLNDSGIASYPFALQSYSASAAYGKLFDLPVTMRATPTCSTSGTFYAMSASGGTQTAFTGKNITNSTKNTISTGDWTGASGMTVGQSQPTNANNGSYIEISAEL